MRMSGCVSRSAPYMILERKYPFTQLRPRFTSAFMSPWVATTRPSLTPTMTPQPVPQNRHGAFDHFSWMSSPARMFWASAGRATFAAAAAALAACALMKVRRERSMALSLFWDGDGDRFGLKVVEDERRREDAREE